MAFTDPIFTKFTLVRLFFVKNCTEFNENPAKVLVDGTA
jgi:hypothetical protein